MFLRLIRVTILAAALLATLVAPVWLTPATPRAEAGGSWAAWIYNMELGRLVQVFPDGAAANDYAFPLPPGVNEYPSMVTFSRDGTLLAACNTDSSGNARVDVYDMFNNMYVGQYLAGGPAMGCSLGRYAFSEDGSLLAFGLLYHYPGDPNDTRPDWELMVMQLNTNAITARLASDSPQIAALNVDIRGKLPFVSTFQMPQANYPGLISFKLVQWGTEGMCEYPGWVWNLGQNQVYEGPNAGKSSLDILLTNSEATWVEVDDSLPQTQLMGPGCAHNVVMYSNKAGDRYALFHDGTVLGSTAFVDDGRQIAFRSMTDTVARWYSIDRSGNVTALPDPIAAYEVWGTLDGYVFMHVPTSPNGPQGAPEVRYHRYINGQVQSFTAWTGQADNSYWRMVYVTPLRGGTGLPPFPPMPRLGTPPEPPQNPDQLVLNGRAVTNTTQGDMLRIRTGAGVSYQVAFQLADGTPVTLVEGPVTSEGYTWWRIQTDDGRTGWAVEGVQDPSEGFIQTLKPLQ